MKRQTYSISDRAEALGSALPPLLVAAERLASTVSLGVHGRRKAGMGETFWQFRRYATHDPSSAVDWRQSAKSQHLFVREREWEAAESVWLWRDGSPNMRFRSATAPDTKLDRATLLALALASLLVRGGERIAVLGENQSPATGRGALLRAAHVLAERAPSDAELPPDAAVSRHSQFVWFSDFLSPPAEIESAIRRLARAGVVGHLVHIVDPEEQDFPFTGRTRFESPSHAQSEVFGRAESAQDAYRDRFRAHCAALTALATRFDWRYLAHRTDHGPETALVALYADIGGEQASLRTA